MTELLEKINAQRKGHKNTPIWMAGQQLLDMAADDPQVLDILKKDIEVTGMGLKEAAAQIKAYSDKNRGRAREFCVPPHVAEDVLREFYKLPKRVTAEDGDPSGANVHKTAKDAGCETASHKKALNLSLADFL